MTQDPLLGKTIGDYHLERRLGRGGMATVYLAKDLKLQRDVAFKVLHSVDASDESSVARFRQEALATAKLEHPNIIHIYDYGSTGQVIYMVTEYCPNGSLNDLLVQMAGRSETLDPDYAVYIASQIALALNFAHKNGVVHRDVKPANILFARDNRPVLADLGIAKALEGPKLTRTMTAIGTPEYMAPEQGRGDPADYRSDLYALGVVLFEMLSGRPPYQANTPWGIVHQHMSEPLPPLRAYNPKVSPALTVAVERALAKEPSQRYQSGAEMAEALQQALRHPEAGAAAVGATQVMRPAWAPPPARPTPPPTIAASRGRGSRILAAVIAVLAVLIILVLVAAATGLPDRLLNPQTAAVTQPPPPAETPTESLPVVAATATEPVDTPTLESTPTAAAVAALITEASVDTPLPPTSTPIVRTTRVVKETPTEPPAAPSPTIEPPTPTQAPSTPQPQATPTPPPAPAKPGVIADFETFGSWKRGDEPYGSFAASKERAHDGASSGKLIYDIPAVENNYVVFEKQPPVPIPGSPQTLTAWVYGDGSGLFLNAWIQDSQGEVRQFPLGRVQHADSWEPMVLSLDPAAPWPQAHISGPDNNKVDYPVSLFGLVLDAEGSAARSGQIYIDELIVGGTAATPAAYAPTPTPAAGSSATQTPIPAPASALSGRIAYPSGGGIMAVDAATGATWQIAPSARQPDAKGPWVLANGSGGGRDNVFIASINGGGERITGMHPEDAYPSWSPSGESAAFSSTITDGQERLYVQWDMTHQEEPTKVQVGGADVFGRNPTWMDNWRIAFTGCNYWAEGSKCGIWAVAADDSGAPYRLTDQADDVSSDSSGGNLLFQSRASGNWDVYVVPSGGGTPRNLTNSPSQDVGAAFSPDSRSIAFMSDRDGSWGVWVVGIDGGVPQKVLAVPGGFGPDWPNERLSWTG